MMHKFICKEQPCVMSLHDGDIKTIPDGPKTEKFKYLNLDMVIAISPLGDTESEILAGDGSGSKWFRVEGNADDIAELVNLMTGLKR